VKTTVLSPQSDVGQSAGEAVRPEPPLTERGFCPLCREWTAKPDYAWVRSNMRRHRDSRFPVWRCAACRSLHSGPAGDLARYYRDYPLRRQRPGFLNRLWFGNLIRRLERAGLRRTDEVLDYGCGDGLLLALLRERGYARCRGFDPFEERFADRGALSRSHEFVICLDVLEHAEDPAAMMDELAALVKPGGRLCLNTPRADGIDLNDPEADLHQLHQPCHRHIFSEAALVRLCARAGLAVESVRTRFLRDHWLPAANWRFGSEYMRVHGNDMEAAFEPPRASAMLRHPRLWALALFGWLLPQKGDSMMLVARKEARPWC
jgi:SAM-dependent methyltransferase